MQIIIAVIRSKYENEHEIFFKNIIYSIDFVGTYYLININL